MSDKQLKSPPSVTVQVARLPQWVQDALADSPNKAAALTQCLRETSVGAMVSEAAAQNIEATRAVGTTVVNMMTRRLDAKEEEAQGFIANLLDGVVERQDARFSKLCAELREMNDHMLSLRDDVNLLASKVEEVSQSGGEAGVGLDAVGTILASALKSREG